MEPSVIAQSQHPRCEDRWVFVSLELAWSIGNPGLHSESMSWKRMEATTSLQSLQSKALPRLLPTTYAYTLENVHEMNNSTETTNRQNHGKVTVANTVLCVYALLNLELNYLYL